MYNEEPMPMYCGANDGGVKRGDRADTGDLEARPKREPKNPPGVVTTADSSALAESTAAVPEDLEDAGTEDLKDLRIVDASSPELGLTNIGQVPPDDWAADTGPSRTAEAEERDELKQADKDDRPIRRRK